MKLILASGSPRRTELLNQIGLQHQIVLSDCEEIITQSAPEQIVMELSRQKAESVWKKQFATDLVEDVVVLGADTIVARDGEILGKPKDEEDAYRMLKSLQGRTHQVYTGVTLTGSSHGKSFCKVFYECSLVQVWSMDEEEIRSYIRTGEPMDKAGAYGIQGAFGAYVKGIEGDYNTIVGLPIARVYHELKLIMD